jgi:hypothetical protein
MDKQLREITCNRTLTGEQFNSGVQDFNFSIDGSSLNDPSESFFAIEMELNTCQQIGGDPVLRQPNESEQIGFSENVCANLYDNISVKAGGQALSETGNFQSQSHMLKTRITKTKAWQESVGRDIYGLDPDFTSRVKAVSKNERQIDNLQSFSVGKPGFENSATLSVMVTTGFIAGVNTDFDGSVTHAADPSVAQIPLVKIGDLLYIKNAAGEYDIRTVNAVTGPTSLTVSGSALATRAASSDFYFARDLFAANSKNRRTFLFKPGCGFFDLTAVGAGTYTISMSPNARYKQQAVESKQNLKVYDAQTKVIGSYDFKIHSVKYYMALSRSAQPLTGVQNLHLHETQIHNKPISSGDNSLDFTVPPSTKMIAFFVQNSKVGYDSRFPPSKFKGALDSDMSVKSFQITYANRSRPSTRWSSNYKNSTDTTSGIQHFTQRYHDSFSEVAMTQLQGGIETFDQYVKRGPLYVYRFDRSSDDMSTQVQLNLSMGDVAKGTNVVMASFYTRSVDVSYSNGMITNVASLNV